MEKRRCEREREELLVALKLEGGGHDSRNAGGL